MTDEEERCPHCDGERWVCESHPHQPWDANESEAGIPCGLCNQGASPVLPCDAEMAVRTA